jgi:DNA-binding NtrC family response regulator
MKAFLFNPKKPLNRTELTDLTILGSDPNANYILPMAESRHARIEFMSGKYILRDLRSQSGTFLNGQRILEAQLQEEDVIQLGTDEVIFSHLSEIPISQFELKSRNQDWNQKLARMGSAAKTDFPVLILGSSGSGKEVLARAIHNASTRSLGPMVSVNCSALTETLIESELFGHLKGSFTGALADRKGAFEAARNGTLFLDEIGDLPLNLQAKLLRALENNEIRPVGGDHSIKTDVRILAATHQNLIEKIQAGEFRADLYYRLNVICIESPSLFERMEDFEGILYKYAKQYKVRFSFLALDRMKKHTWPGNIRELKNTVARACALFPKQTIEVEHVEMILDKLSRGPQSQALIAGENSPLSMIKEMEKQMILKKLAANKGNQRQTANELGLPKSTLHDRLKTYNIDPKSFAN